MFERMMTWEIPVGVPGRIVTIRIFGTKEQVEWEAKFPDGFTFLVSTAPVALRSMAFEDARREIARMDRAGDLGPEQFGLEG